MRGDDQIDKALALGIANAEVVELAHHHCQLMEFVQIGGYSMLEGATGLPISMRTIRCPKVNGSMGGSQLKIIAGDFYRSNCVGCEMRKPTGQLPTLATEIEAEDQAARDAAAEQARARAVAHEDWERRATARRAASVATDPAMTKAISDLGVIDQDPFEELDDKAVAAALKRLNALLGRAPQTVTNEFVEMALGLVRNQGRRALLGPLRLLARTQVELQGRLVPIALDYLDEVGDPEAARVLVDFRSLVTSDQLTAAVARSLVRIGFGPSDSSYGQLGAPTVADPAGLALMAEVAPLALVEGLTSMLPGPRPAPSLLLPPGADAPESGYNEPERDRAAAAAAIDWLISSHPVLVESLTEPLVRSVLVTGDFYDHYPSSRVKETLAHCILVEIPGVEAAIAAAGKSASDDDRDELFDCYRRLARFLDEDRPFGGPRKKLRVAERHRVLDRVITLSLEMVGGAWGSQVVASAARLIETTARDNAAWMYPRVDSLFGAFLTALRGMNAVPARPLVTPEDPNPFVSGMEAYTGKTMFSIAAADLLRAASHAAVVDPHAVAESAIALVRHERDADVEAEATWRLIPFLGELGARHGNQPKVLSTVLAVLHTYLVDADFTLRTRAIAAWGAIAGAHAVPSTLEDLLPALLEDEHVAVMTALLENVTRIRWTESGLDQILVYVFRLCMSVPSDEHLDLRKALVSATVRLSRRRPQSQEVLQGVALSVAMHFESYDLREALELPWSDDIKSSEAIARLRLMQFADPRINDQFNPHGDSQLVDLLEADGTRSLTLEEFTSAAVSFGPDRLRAGLQVVEAVWMTGRYSDARSVAHELLNMLPSTPAYAGQRSLVETVDQVLGLELEAPSNPPAKHGTTTESRIEKQAAALEESRTLLREALGDLESEGLPVRGASLRRVSDAMTGLARITTPTATVVRSFAALCRAASHVLAAEAAVLEAEESKAVAEMKAARRHAAGAFRILRDQFGEGHPVAGPLMSVLKSVSEDSDSSDLIDQMGSWSTLVVPLMIAEGHPLERTRPAVQEDPPEEAAATAVILVSIDDRLITGPAVLQPDTVYRLGVEVQPDPWPEWATSMELEFIGAIGAAEIQLPSMSWKKPSSDNIYQAEGTLVLRFGLPSGQPAPPFLVAVRWRGQRDKREVVRALDVAGHTQIRLRPYDATRDALTSFPELDEHLLRIYAQLAGAGHRDAELQAFSRLFSAICREGFRFTWDRRYKKGSSVDEKKFHDDLFDLLKSDPDLGGRVERGTELALGYLDIRHDGVTAELKVERSTPVTEESAPKYMGQPTQYAAADGSRLSILAVLDMSPKELPIGTPENYIFLLEPALHGLTNPEAPSTVAAVVVNGNLPAPSSWQRRKSARQTRP